MSAPKVPLFADEKGAQKIAALDCKREAALGLSQARRHVKAVKESGPLSSHRGDLGRAHKGV